MASELASTITARPPALVAGLAILPPELVHQIFNDLPVIKILKILSHELSHIDFCALTHPVYQHVFSSQTVLDSIRGLFKTYHEICKHIRCTLSPRTSILSRNISTSPEPLTTDMLHDYLSAEIFNFLTKANPWVKLLVSHSTKAPPMMLDRSPADLRERWLWIRDAEAALNNAKSRELSLAADILESEVGRSMLKTPLDPSQEGPRANIGHIVRRLRGDANQVLKDRIFAARFYTKRHWAISQLPVVAYDSYLERFLNTLQTYPPKNELGGAAEFLHSIFVTEVSDQTTERPGIFHNGKNQNLAQRYVYPSEIAADISVILKGLHGMYTNSGSTSTKSPMPRISTSLLHDTSSLEANIRAKFVINHRAHYAYWSEEKNFFVASGRNRPETSAPHDEREYVWLQAFLRVASWMEKEMAVD